MTEPAITEGRYKSDFLKVEKKEGNDHDILIVIRAHANLIHELNYTDDKDPRLVGYFNEILRRRDWSLLSFDPYSVDCGFRDSTYQTRDLALDAAIAYLDGFGFKAKAFDLEGMIDKL